MILAALALSLFAAPATAQQTAPDLNDPVKLFEGVCLGDQVRLPRDAVASQAYDALPQGAKSALGFANPPGGIPRIQPPLALPAAEVPNRILAVLPKRENFLLLPATGTGIYAASCSVLWKGNHYPQALAAAKTVAFGGNNPPAGTPPLTTPITGLNWAVFTTNGMIVGAAEYGGWTVLRISPDPATQGQSTP